MNARIQLLLGLLLALAAPATPQSSLLVQPTGTTIASATFPELADLDGDGRLDVVVSPNTGATVLAVHLNQSQFSAGQLASGTMMALPSAGAATGTADFDGDGDLDLIVATGIEGTACFQSRHLQVFDNTSPQPGFFSLTPGSPQSISYPAFGLAIGNFSGSQDNEVAVLDGCNDLVHVYHYLPGSGAFQLQQSHPVGSGCNRLLAGDMDGNGYDDLVAGSSNGIHIVYGFGSGTTFLASIAVSSQNGLAIGDVDGNGLLDLVAAGNGVFGAQLTLALQVSPSNFTTSSFGSFYSMGDVELANLDGDGFPDVLLAEGQGAGQSRVMAILNQASAPYFTGSGVVFATNGSGTSVIDAGDVDGLPGDDLVRVLRSASFQSEIQVWRNTTPQQDCVGTPFCTPAAFNSAGKQGRLLLCGSPQVATNDLQMRAEELPLGVFGYFLASPTNGAGTVPLGSQGVLCLTGAIGRFNGAGQLGFSGPQGRFTLDVDLGTFPVPMGVTSILAGDVRHFQAWYRDTVAGVPTSNFTDAVTLTFQ